MVVGTYFISKPLQALDVQFIDVYKRQTEFLAKATEFATKNDTTNMTAEEAQKQIMTLFIDAAKAKKSSIELKDVTVTVTMEKKDDKWDLSTDSSNMDNVAELLTGSTTDELAEYMYSLYGGSLT